jgi:hypothetical protein
VLALSKNSRGVPPAPPGGSNFRSRVCSVVPVISASCSQKFSAVICNSTCRDNRQVSSSLATRVDMLRVRLCALKQFCHMTTVVDDEN